MPLATAAMVDADGNKQKHGTVQIHVYGRVGSLPRSWGESSAQLATGAEVTVVDSLYSASGSIEGGCIRGQVAAPGKT